MEEIFNFFHKFVDVYWGTSVYQGIFYMAVIYILIHEKDRKKNLMYGLYPMVLLIAIFNPVTLKAVTIFFREDNSVFYYFRLFSFMPMMCIMAYGLVLLLKDLNGVKKLCVVILIFGIIMVGGNNVYSSDWMCKAENINKIPEAAKQICWLVHSDEKKVKIAVPSDVSSYIRQYDATILMPYGRTDSGWDDILLGSEPNVEMILTRAKSNACDFVVVEYNDFMLQAFSEWGLEVYGYTDSYLIYEVKGVPGIVQEYNDKNQIISVTYVDKDGIPTVDNRGYATVKYEYDKYGRNVYESYYDTDGKAVNLLGGYYGVRREYNRDNTIKKVIYVDVTGKNMISKLGYSSVVYEYNKNNKVSYEYYLDEKNNPIEVNGYYGRITQYNDDEQKIKVMCVDEHKNAVISDYGYVSIAYVYNEDGEIKGELYLDIEDNPVEVSGGYYGLRKEYDENNRVIEIVYLGSDNTETETIYGYSKVLYQYDDNGTLVETVYVDLEGDKEISEKDSWRVD